MHLIRRTWAILTAVTLLVLAGATGAHAADNPFERGPDPTESSIEQSRGPYNVSERSISRFSASGFQDGTMYYPSSISDGTFGVVAISPGYTASESTIAWLGPRIASFGFVVVTINTNSRYDQPRQRSTQLLAALDHAINDSVVGPRIAPDRQAVMGHSMGGGGALQAAEDRDEILAAVPLTPWNLKKTWRSVDAATLVIGAQNDTTAPVRSHSIPFYESLTGAERRGYLELRGASHFAPNISNTTIAKYSIAWLKRYVDSDTRYEQFISPGPRVGITTGVSDYRID
ncbi:alpha/beta hydrolase family protein [Jonesia quinghaiensis]|uniref:alpha/beta hydrolase family protein n=1 Tax=Jonesia quinghaiensis TaxID=262806 RepID=UPI00042A5E16|nr:lipase [Jonesia quinghaiensis]